MAAFALSVFGLLFLASIPVAAVLGILAIALVSFYSPLPLLRALGEVTWSTSNDALLVAVPLYIFMGEVLLRSGIATRMYESMAHWLAWLPGGLMHSNVGACAMFAATSGSSVATAATVSTVALPEQQRYGYNERLFLGSLAAGGTLGILIPPSINLILYGFITDTSVPQLYLAAFIPGAAAAGIFLAIIAALCTVVRGWGGTRKGVDWPTRWRSLLNLAPPLALFVLVVGSIYSGLATPTESAALGVVGALALAAVNRTLTFPMLATAFENTFRVTGMTMMIVLGAYFLNFVLSTLGLTRDAVAYINGLGLSSLGLMIGIIVLYLILGCFMDSMAMMITTLPIVSPLVTAAGYDPVWFGVLLVILCEAGMITPPFGINLFVVQTVRRRGSLNDVIYGAIPFLIGICVLIAVILAFPATVLWLPHLVRGG